MQDKTRIFDHSLSCLAEADVIVLGAGPAGCAAAITASRMGRETLLIEKYGFAGGAAVNQLVPVVLSQNGIDFQGIWHEFMLEMKNNGLIKEMEKGEQCDHWLSTTYSPESAKLAWDNLLKKANVRVLFHTIVYDLTMNGKNVESLMINTRAGNYCIKAPIVIDCTGDGHICSLAGMPFEQGNKLGPVSQAATKMFRLVNSIKPEHLLTKDRQQILAESFAQAIKNGEYKSPVMTSGFIMDYINNRAGKQIPDDTLLINATRMINVNPLDPWELSQAEIDGRAYAKECADFFIKYVPGSENAKLLETSIEMGIRASRRIIGQYQLTLDDVLELRKFPDGIAKGSWEIDIHPPSSYQYKRLENMPMYEEFHRRIAQGDYYEIPLGCLIPKQTGNVLVAGRSISAESEAQGSLRIQQTCMATGEAAGCLAALAVLEKEGIRGVSALKVRTLLEETRSKTPVAFSILEKN